MNTPYPSSRGAKLLSLSVAALFAILPAFAAVPQNMITDPATTHHYGPVGVGALGIDGNPSTAQQGQQTGNTPSVIVTSEHRFPLPVDITSIRLHALADALYGSLPLTDQSPAIWMMAKVGTEYTLDGVEWIDLDVATHIQKTRFRDQFDYEDEDGDGDPNNEEAAGGNPFIEPFANIRALVDGTFEVNLNDVRGIRVIAKGRTHGDSPTGSLTRAAIHEFAAYGKIANNAPNAAEDYAFSYPAGVLIDVLDNDTDPEGSPLSLVSISSATNGTAQIVGQKVLFVPSGPLNVNEGSLTYVVTDGEDTATGTVTVFDPPDVGKRYAGTLHKPGSSAEPVGIANILFAAEGAATGAITRLRLRFPFKGGIGFESPAFFAARLNKTTTIPLRVSAGPRDVAGNPTITFVMDSPNGTQRWSGISSQSPYNRDNFSPFNGRYTVAADAGAGAPVPSVGGVFNLIASRLGFVSVLGKAGNGRGFRVSSMVLEGDTVPFYAALNSGLTPGSISGSFNLSTTGPQHVSGTARWVSPVGAESRLPAGLDSTFPCIGARYAHTGTPSSMLTFNPSGLGDLSFTALSSGGDVQLTRQFAIARLIPGPEPLLNLRTLLGSGMVAGRILVDPTKSRRAFQAVCIQGAGLNYGVGFVVDATQLGRVTLHPQP